MKLSKLSLKRRWYEWNAKHENTWYKFVGMSFLAAVISLTGQTIWTIHAINHEVPVVEVVHAKEEIKIEGEVAIRDFVLSEVEKAGLDKYKVYLMIETCENPEWNPDAHFVNYGNKAGVDRGIFMINDIFHKEVSNACAFDLQCNVREGIRILKQKGFKEWSCGRKLKL